MTTTWAHTIVDEAEYMNHDEIDLIDSTAQTLPIGAVCLNLGTGPGTSVIALLEARHDLMAYTVDYTPGQGMDNVIRAGVSDRCIEIAADSRQLEWKRGAIDWLMIDTDHSYENVMAEINKWIPLCRGLVLFHDYTFAARALRWEQVKRAADEWANGRKPIGQAGALIVFDLRLTPDTRDGQ